MPAALMKYESQVSIMVVIGVENCMVSSVHLSTSSTELSWQ